MINFSIIPMDRDKFLKYIIHMWRTWGKKSEGYIKWDKIYFYSCKCETCFVLSNIVSHSFRKLSYTHLTYIVAQSDKTVTNTHTPQTKTALLQKIIFDETAENINIFITELSCGSWRSIGNSDLSRGHHRDQLVFGANQSELGCKPKSYRCHESDCSVSCRQIPLSTQEFIQFSNISSFCSWILLIRDRGVNSENIRICLNAAQSKL